MLFRSEGSEKYREIGRVGWGDWKSRIPPFIARGKGPSSIKMVLGCAHTSKPGRVRTNAQNTTDVSKRVRSYPV